MARKRPLPNPPPQAGEGEIGRCVFPSPACGGGSRAQREGGGEATRSFAGASSLLYFVARHHPAALELRSGGWYDANRTARGGTMIPKQKSADQAPGHGPLVVGLVILLLA